MHRIDGRQGSRMRADVLIQVRFEGCGEELSCHSGTQWLAGGPGPKIILNAAIVGFSSKVRNLCWPRTVAVCFESGSHCELLARGMVSEYCEG